MPARWTGPEPRRRSFDAIATYGARIEIETLRRRWQNAEEELIDLVRRRLEMGLRAEDAAEMLHVSRATLYRWLKTHESRDRK